jgi:hypothetical protein
LFVNYNIIADIFIRINSRKLPLITLLANYEVRIASCTIALNEGGAMSGYSSLQAKKELVLSIQSCRFY